jgi:hypothetical protein
MAKREHRGNKQTVDQFNAIKAINPQSIAVISKVFSNCIEFPGTRIFVTVYPNFCGYADDTKIIRKNISGTDTSMAKAILKMADQ